MTKSELIQRLAQKYKHLQLKDVERLVNTIFEEISKALEEGRRVELRGFGAFSLREREPRKARNPKTGEEVRVGSRNALYFRTGKQLRDRINKSGDQAA